mmetsp:Transcript_17003/g.31783  ORF Transcript_17003/g.31783 Transcript_17003/m.31783 type:complete len:305 (-) Transcript_17003:265-1179(-)
MVFITQPSCSHYLSLCCSCLWIRVIVTVGEWFLPNSFINKNTRDITRGVHRKHHFEMNNSSSGDTNKPYRPMSDFLELNQSGLCAIDNQEYTRAVDLYRRAIQSLNEERGATPPPLPGGRTFPHRLFRALAIPLELDEYTAGAYFTNATASQDGQYLLYDVAFLIDFQDILYAYPFIVTTILYNMALALHLDGLEHPNHARLQQAQNVYEAALRYFHSTGRSILEHTRMKECRLLFFAIVNNCGHCCALLSDQDGMRKAQEVLQSLLADSYSLASLGLEDERFFRMSILIGTLRTTVSSLPPAA